MTMRAAYAPLFSVEIRHGFYRARHPGGDLVLVPTPETAHLIRQRAWIFRPSNHGATVYAEVSAAGPDPRLLRPVGPGGIRLAFTLTPRVPFLAGVSDLPRTRPGRELFCFDNLSADVDDGRLHLGDSVAGSRRGPPVGLATGSDLLYEFDPPVVRTRVECHDRFGDRMFGVDVRSPRPPEPIAEARLDEWSLLEPGRYVLSDDAGHSSAVYREPGLQGQSPLGVVEIFDWSGALSPDVVDRVPEPYRFLAGDLVTFKAYVVQFAPRATTWRYVVVSKTKPGELVLDELTINGPQAFTGVVDGDQVTFTSDAALALSQVPADITLDDAAGATLLELPSPSVSTPLATEPITNDLVSPMYVYI